MFPAHKHPRRAAFTVTEVSVALAITSAALLGLAQMVSLAASQRRSSEVRRLAREDVANLAERLALAAFDELTEAKLAKLELSSELLAAAPQAKLSATVLEQAGPPASKRIRLQVSWTSAVGQATLPVGLTIWRFAETPEGQP